jgi:hypothetical protein
VSESPSVPQTQAHDQACPWCPPPEEIAAQLVDLEQLRVEADQLRLAQAPEYDQVER